jgi:F-type H+-transporting ATPase subunit delta
VELTTIAKPYANAVFEIAQQNKSHADWKGVDYLTLCLALR